MEPAPIVVDLPLRGEWMTPNTPGKQVPSHGTDMLGQRYAYDFVRTDPASRSMKFYRQHPLIAIPFGVKLADCYGWGQPIYAPASGVVVRALDGWPERQRVHIVRDLAIAIKNGLTFNPFKAGNLQQLAGNYIIIETPDAFAFLAHARRGSIRVKEGERVIVGQQIAEVGHSGNTTAPHLHFQLSDSLDLLTARGLPCCFREYEVLRDGAWQTVTNGIPTHTERIRR
jgi:murein DD-endopeptidase MepM/ murein hydrolase activator NlpD